MAVALVTLVSGGGAAAFTSPPKLSGESFHQDTSTITSIDCEESLNFTYSAIGTATGPYPGTFTETGTLNGNVHHANFTINSPVGRVTGSVSGSAGVSCSQGGTCSGAVACEQLIENGSGAAFNTDPSGFAAGDTYQATIATADGSFLDEGLFSAVLYRVQRNDPANHFDESFLSQLVDPVPLMPGTKSQCRHGGWKQFGLSSSFGSPFEVLPFKNQGQCIALVAHGPN